MDTTEGDGIAAQIGQRQTTMQLSRNSRRGALQGRIVHWLFFACAAMSVVTTFGIVARLLSPSLGGCREIPVWDFLFGATWSPILRDAEGNRHYGVLPLVSGTLLVASIAAAVQGRPRRAAEVQGRPLQAAARGRARHRDPVGARPEPLPRSGGRLAAE